MSEGSLLFSFLQNHLALGYAIVFLGMIFEGEGILFVAAFLAEAGYFQEWILTLDVFVSLMIGSAFWYWLGLKIHGTFLHRWAEKAAKPFDGHLQRRTMHTVLFSKFIYGIHHFLLLRAGTLHILFSKYMKDNFVANFVWMVIVGGVGYFAGASFMLVKHYVKFVEIALFLGLVIFLLVWHYVISEKLKKEL